MSDDSYSFSTARARLEDIVTQVRKKDTSLEKSLDLLEEGVRLANTCTELIDHADWTVGGVGDPAEEVEGSAEPLEASEGGQEADLVAEDETHEAVDSEDCVENPDGAPEYRDDEA